MLLARAEIGPGRLGDVRVGGGTITAIADRLHPLPDEDVVDAASNAVLPGLHDHHVHLRALAAASASLDLAAVAGPDAARAALRAACDRVPPGAWLRVVGFHEALTGDLDRTRLDELTSPDTPVRVQHRSGAMWVFNSAAMRASGLDARAERGVDRRAGRLWRRDDLVRRVSALPRAALTEVGTRAAALGVTGFTDATPDGERIDARDLARDLRAAGVVQRLHLMAPIGATSARRARRHPRTGEGPARRRRAAHARRPRRHDPRRAPRAPRRCVPLRDPTPARRRARRARRGRGRAR